MEHLIGGQLFLIDLPDYSSFTWRSIGPCHWREDLGPSDMVFAWYTEGANNMHILPQGVETDELAGEIPHVSPNCNLLTEGEPVKIKQAHGRKWKKATVVAPWSYLVKDYKGQVFCKNSKQMVKTQQKPSFIIPKHYDFALSTALQNEVEPPKSGSGRVIKKLERLNL
ncbi:hypothetical protein SK128_013984 [Halocaridina rubra]|uniref:Uncharacterized protein n=1 Tax=Halocaridina rubra TaxID=373956 RepID=A0AAN8WTP2_HALRR